MWVRLPLRAHMEIKGKLNELGINYENSIVIGSGILNALGLRESKDIDIVATEGKYNELAKNNRFKNENKNGRDMLVDELFEIGTSWTVIGKTWVFDDLLPHSTVIGEVRYNKVEFLLEAKRSWIANGEGREKDIEDVRLMENYLEMQK